MLGLTIHGFIVLSIIYSVVTRKAPFRFVGNMTQAITTAFGTASRYFLTVLFGFLIIGNWVCLLNFYNSSATLPITIGCLESKNNVDPRVARFVLPIGATINVKLFNLAICNK